MTAFYNTTKYSIYNKMICREIWLSVIFGFLVGILDVPIFSMRLKKLMTRSLCLTLIFEWPRKKWSIGTKVIRFS